MSSAGRSVPIVVTVEKAPNRLPPRRSLGSGRYYGSEIVARLSSQTLPDQVVGPEK